MPPTASRKASRIHKRSPAPRASARKGRTGVRSSGPPGRFRWWMLLLALGALGLTLLAGTYVYFNTQLTEAMGSQTWEVPSSLYPRSLWLEKGQHAPPGPFEKTLSAMGYTVAPRVRAPGDYRIAGPGRYYVQPRAGWKGLSGVQNGPIEVGIQSGVVTTLRKVNGPALNRTLIPAVPFAEIRRQDQETRRLVKLDDVPRVLIDAVLAIEDQRFYSHFGIDPKGLLRAVVVNLSRGHSAQGGSTITQQLVKNRFLTHEKSYDRKLREIFYAVALEQRLPKKQILEQYLNGIYLGQRGAVPLCGMAQAAWVFFSKELRNLTLEEAALLAGIIQAPNALAPDRHPEKAQARRDVVLKKMFEQKKITREELDQALKRPLKLKPPPYLGRTAPFFVDYVDELLGQRLPDAQFSSEGYVFETTLDLRIQQAAERALEHGLQRLTSTTKARLEGAVVVLEPTSGRILAMVGGHQYGTSQFNRAVLAKRQPGSVFKPLVLLGVLQASGEEIGPTTVVQDEPLTLQVGGKSWSPRNNDGLFRGPVTVRQTIEQSINVPMVRLATDAGLDKIIKTLKSLKLSAQLKPVPSLALGSFEVSPLEVATAYTAIADQGRLHPAFGIERVRERDGKVVTENKPESIQVATPQQTWMLRDLMRGVFTHGTARSAAQLGYSHTASGKTGTTNEARDAWFVGFDEELLAVVWIGSDKPVSTGLTGGKAALPIWVELMKEARQADPPPEDVMPQGLTRMQVCAASLQQPGPQCPELREEVFWTGHTPQASCPTHAGLLEQILDKIEAIPQLLDGVGAGTD